MYAHETKLVCKLMLDHIYHRVAINYTGQMKTVLVQK